MNSETIYQIIHSILADEATDEERRIFTEWLDASDTNRAEYEKLKRLYQVTTHRSKNKTFNTEFAWQQVHKQTISKRKHSDCLFGHVMQQWSPLLYLPV